MASPRRKKRFLLCVRNTGCEDLELRKLYEHLPDDVAAREGYVRVVDESGEDYLYPKIYFAAVRLPGEAQRALARRPMNTFSRREPAWESPGHIPPTGPAAAEPAAVSRPTYGDTLS